MKRFLIILLVTLGLIFLVGITFGNEIFNNSPTPTPIPTVAIIPTNTPIPTSTPIPVQQSTYFGNVLACPTVYFQGATPCVDTYKTPVACVNQTIPNPNIPLTVANFICGIPGNSASIKSCIWYANTPNLITCF